MSSVVLIYYISLYASFQALSAEKKGLEMHVILAYVHINSYLRETLLLVDLQELDGRGQMELLAV
jgi:hypothetical protein